MITYVTDTAIQRGDKLPALQAVLTQQLAKVERRQARIKNRRAGGAPKREQDWR
jgi:hypothetical protein